MLADELDDGFEVVRGFDRRIAEGALAVLVVAHRHVGVLQGRPCEHTRHGLVGPDDAFSPEGL